MQINILTSLGSLLRLNVEEGDLPRLLTTDRLLKQLNHHLEKSVFEVFKYNAELVAIAIDVGEGEGEGNPEGIVLHLNECNGAFLLRDIYYTSQFPPDAPLISVKSLPVQPVEESSVWTIFCDGPKDSRVYRRKKIKHKQLSSHHHESTETTHGNWHLPRGLSSDYHEEVCFKEGCLSPKPLLEFLNPNSDHFCPVVVQYVTSMLESSKVLAVDSVVGKTLANFLFQGEIIQGKWLVSMNGYELYEKLDSKTRKIIAYKDRNSILLRSPKKSSWVYPRQTFNVMINSTNTAVNMTVALAYRLMGVAFEDDHAMIPYKAAIPKSLEKILALGGKIKLHINLTTEALRKICDFNLRMKDGKLVLSIERHGTHFLLDIEVNPETKVIKVVDYNESFKPQTLNSNGLIFTKSTKCLREIVFGNLLNLNVCNFGQDVNVIGASNDMAIKVRGNEEASHNWMLYAPISAPSNYRLLYRKVGEDHCALIGFFNAARTRFTVEHCALIHEGSCDDMMNWLSREFSVLASESTLTPVEFFEHKNLSDFDPSLDNKANHKLLSITSYAFHSDNECYVDLLVRTGRSDFGYYKFRYSFTDTENIPNRMLKACIEAMAIRHCLLEHYSGPEDILRGSNMLKLEVSSGKLFAILKGQQEPPQDLWPLMRYLTVRGHDGRITLKNEPINNPAPLSRTISLSQNEGVMAYDECLKMSGFNLLITRHAIIRSDERRYNERWHSAWGFIASKALEHFSSQASRQALKQQQTANGIIYIGPDDWNFVTKQTQGSCITTVATIYQGLYDNQRYEQDLHMVAG
jgi:hypothetical protein